MVSRDGAFGLLIGAAVGACSLVLACGSPQDAQSVLCPYVGASPRLEDLTRCAEEGDAVAQYSLGVAYGFGEGAPEDWNSHGLVDTRGLEF